MSTAVVEADLKLELSLKANIDTVLAQADAHTKLLWPRIVSVQQKWLNARGRCFQGILTHSTPPADGRTVLPDLDRRPTDQSESWRDEGFDYRNPPCSYQIDPYDGPSGKGFLVIRRVRRLRRTWEHCINVGPERHRAHDWRQA